MSALRGRRAAAEAGQLVADSLSRASGRDPLTAASGVRHPSAIVNRREWLTFLLVLPFVASTPYLLPAGPLWARLVVSGTYLVIGLIVVRFVAVRLTR